jgi:hypothetical protein
MARLTRTMAVSNLFVANIHLLEGTVYRRLQFRSLYCETKELNIPATGRVFVISAFSGAGWGPLKDFHCSANAGGAGAVTLVRD